MTTLGDRLYAQFGGDVPSTPQQLAQDAIRRYGSGRAAARELGVDEKTIRRWKNGETRHSENVDRWAREARRGQAERHRGDPIEVKFRFAGRERTLRVGGGERQKLAPGAEKRIEDAYVAGDREAMASEFVGGVADPFYRGKLREAYRYDLAGVETVDAGEGSSSPAVFTA